jgi:DNA-binding beta-propeller fold protein YncE
MAPKSIDLIFWEAAQLPSERERKEYLDGACGDDGRLRERVEQLLMVRGQVSKFLESPASNFVATADEAVDMIYVGNGSGVCNGIDGKEYKVVFSTPAEHADNVYYHSGKKMVYVAHGETVSVLDAKTGEVKAKIAAGGKTEEFRVDKKANKMFVNLKPSVVAVIDLEKNEVVDRFKLTMSDANGPMAYDDKAGLLFVGCGGKAPMIIALDAKTGKELTNVEIPAGIDNLHYDSKRNRLYASCGDGFLTVIEKKGDKYEVIAKYEEPKKSKTSIYNGGLGRLYLGVPKQAGKEGPEVRVYVAKPVIEAKP